MEPSVSVHRISSFPHIPFCFHSVDMHMRTLHRLISKETVLYTEMITTNTLVRTSEPERYLESNFAVEEPLVLQLGGSCPTDMRTASAMARRIGFQEININAGCPSEKVSGSVFLFLFLVSVTLFSLLSSPVCFIFLFSSQILFNTIFF